MKNYFVLLAFVGCFVHTTSLMAGGTSPASQGASELTQRMKRFYEMASVPLPPPLSLDSQKRAAETFAKLLDSEIAVNPKASDYLNFYLAKSLQIVGSERANNLALAAAKDLDDPNCADARYLLWWNDRSWNGTEFNAASQDRSVFNHEARESLAAIFPKGIFADELSLDKPKSPLPSGNFISGSGGGIHLEQRANTAAEAAALYEKMNMYPEAIRTYRLAAGFLSPNNWISPQSASIWMAVGDCYMSERQSRRALQYYYKSLASGSALAEISPRIQRASVDQQNKEAVPEIKVEQKADAAMLESIGKLLASTDLFDEAIEAAASAEKLRGTRGGLVPALHSGKAAMMQNVLNATQEGIVIRGVLINSNEIKAEDSLGGKR